MLYIDPGAGTIIVQMIVAAFIGGAAYFRKAIASLLGFRRRRPTDTGE